MTLPAEVDISNADQVRQDLVKLLVEGASLVVADMSATTFCDSAGVMALVRAARKAAASGTRLRVAASTTAVARVLAIIGVDRLIAIYPSVASAMADPGTEVAGQDHAARSGQADPDGRAPQPGLNLPADGASQEPGPPLGGRSGRTA